MREEAIRELDALLGRYPALSVCEAEIRGAAQLLAEGFARGGKLIACGNGGSAADCQHIVGELMKGFALRRKIGEEWRARFAAVDADEAEGLTATLQGALPAVSLAGETALSTAFANDENAEYTFAQQVFGLGEEGDTLLCLSTSGNSKNVLHAAVAAKAKGMRVVGLTGESGGRLRRLCDVCIRVPAREAYSAQELHLPVYHALCLALEQEFFGGELQADR